MKRRLRLPSTTVVVQVLALAALLITLRWLVADFRYESLIGLITAVVAVIASFAQTQKPAPAPDPTLSVNPERRTSLLKHMAEISMGRVNSSVRGLALIDLGLETRPDVVALSSEYELPYIQQKRRPVSAGKTIIEVYDEAAGSLLILGQPGAGKTTQLWEITSELIHRAQLHDERPVPVIFNLASWTENRHPIQEWMTEELHTRFGMQVQEAKQWVVKENILPLLDGLDEVRDEYRLACVEAINQFWQDHGHMKLVVCSRTSDYELLTTPLKFGTAVELCPLTIEQIDSYLQKGGDDLAEARRVFQIETAYQDIVNTPLMLSVLVLAYHGKPVGSTVMLDSSGDRRKALIELYVQQMLGRVRAGELYTPTQILHWLAWLASTLARQTQVDFFIDGMQPRSWLSSSALLAYLIIVRLVAGLPIALTGALICGSLAAMIAGPQVGLTGALAGGLAGGLVGGLAGGLFVGLAGFLAAILAVALTAGMDNMLLAGLIMGASAGMGIGILSAIAVELGTIPRDELLLRVAGGTVSGLCIALPAAVLLTNARGQSTELLAGLIVGMLIGFILSLAGSIATRFAAVVGRWALSASIARATKTSSGIDLVDLVRWSPQQAVTGLAISLPVVILAVFLAGVPIALLLAVVIALITGMRNRQVEIFINPRPNHRVWRSGRSALRIGLMSSLVIGFTVGLLSQPIYGVLGGIAVGVAGSINFGGFAFIQHFILRFILYSGGHLPWQYARFLDYCARLTFLQKIGAGYHFHQVILEYFASSR
jgi:hypothetical protein